MARIAPVFIGHGSPMQIPEGAPGRGFLGRLGTELPKPTAILCVSAHWETREPTVSTTAAPETIYDYYGFPDELYAVTYPAPGAPDMARHAADLLTKAGLACGLDETQGLDHGAWVPLRLMYPDADVPVAQLSLQHHLGPGHHLAVGRALAPLAEDGVLVLGAGNLTHNMQAAIRSMQGGPDAEPEEWALGFDRWIGDAVTEGRWDDLVNYRSLAPFAEMAHPRDEHYLPLLVAAGAGGSDARGRRLNDEFLYGTLSQAAYAFDAP